MRIYPEDKKDLEIWEAKTHIGYIQDRENYLLNLRYQLAFVTITIIVGIWTIIVGFISQISKDPKSTNITFLVNFGLIITIFIILIWRLFTRIISSEAIKLDVARLHRLNDLTLIDEKNIHFKYIENSLKLKGDYTNGPSDAQQRLRKKLTIIEKLSLLIPDSGIVMFDKFSAVFVWILIVILLSVNWTFVNFSPKWNVEFPTDHIYYIIMIPVLALEVYYVGIPIYRRLKSETVIQSEKDQSNE